MSKEPPPLPNEIKNFVTGETKYPVPNEWKWVRVVFYGFVAVCCLYMFGCFDRAEKHIWIDNQPSPQWEPMYPNLRK